LGGRKAAVLPLPDRVGDPVPHKLCQTTPLDLLLKLKSDGLAFRP